MNKNEIIKDIINLFEKVLIEKNISNEKEFISYLKKKEKQLVLLLVTFSDNKKEQKDILELIDILNEIYSNTNIENIKNIYIYLKGKF